MTGDASSRRDADGRDSRERRLDRLAHGHRERTIYARAGVQLPRTSQAQRNAGHQVPLSEARPGDLVIYRSDASHVAMYVGNGQVIHAPHPGAAVRYDRVGMLPVSAVTRP